MVRWRNLRFTALALVWAVCPVWSQSPQPCDDATYATYKALYDYDAKAPLNAKVTKSTKLGTTQVDEFEFDSINGERVPGLLIIPPSQKKRPVVLGLHGLGGSKDDFARAAPMMGLMGVQFAILALDAQYHGARKKDGAALISKDLEASKKAFIQTVVDYRRALDYAATRPELNLERVGIGGASMGAIMGVVLTAVEPRVTTSVLVVGGADWTTIAKETQLPGVRQLWADDPNLDWDAFRKTTAPIDPLHFAPRMGERPILLVNAKRDEVIPLKSAQLLHEVAKGKPLEKEWYDSGHVPPAEQVGMRLITWFQENL